MRALILGAVRFGRPCQQLLVGDGQIVDAELVHLKDKQEHLFGKQVDELVKQRRKIVHPPRG